MSELSPFFLWPLLRGIGDRFRAEARERGLSIMIFIDPKLPSEFLGDASKIEFVLNKFIENALRYTARGGVIIRVQPRERFESTLSSLEEMQLVRFSVSDTGIGLTETALTQLFNGDKSLRICQDVLDLMGANLGVESQVGKGSLFWFDAQLYTSRISVEGKSSSLNRSKNEGRQSPNS